MKSSDTVLLQTGGKITIANAVATLPLPAAPTDGQNIAPIAGTSQGVRRMALKVKASASTVTLTGVTVWVYVDGDWCKHTIISPDITFAAGDLVRLVILDLVVGSKILVAGTVGGAGTVTIIGYPLEVTV